MLTEFSYLRKHRILTLALVLVLSSTLFSVTAFSLLGFYMGFSAYLGGGEGIVTIYDTRNRTPFTGMVPAYLAERVSVLNGVLASSPEVIAPCFIGDEPFFLRGIIPEDFTKLNQLATVDGDVLELNDTDSMVVGRSLAERLKLKQGDRVLVLGVLADRFLELQVKGIYESHSAMDDEALAPLYIGQWLRGKGYGYVTLIRFKIDGNVASPSMIFEEVGKEASGLAPGDGAGQTPSGISILPGVRARFRIEDIGVERAQGFVKSQMDRFGVTREALLVLSVMVFLFSSVSVVSASKTIIGQHRREIEVLRSIGASKKAIRRDILIKLLPWSLVASAIGIVLATVTLRVVQEHGYLQVLSHRVPLQFDPVMAAANFILVSLLVSIIILRSDLK